jgi:hypothetical protein
MLPRIRSPARASSWALTLLLIVACGKAQEMTVTVDGLDLRAEAREDAAVVERLPLGARVQVHEPRFWEDAAWHRVVTETGLRWTKLEGLAPYPLRGETRFVRLEELPVHATREPAGRVVETLALGDEVQLLADEPPGTPEYRGVTRGGTPRGFVDAFGLGAERPTTRSLLESARESLQKGALDEAKLLASAARAMAAGSGRSGALVEALTQAESAPSSLREELTGFTEKARGEAVPAKGSVAYVIPYRAPLREGPDLRDPITTLLPTDAAVEVLDLQGPWAHVALIAKQTPWMSVDLGDLAQVEAGETAALSPGQRGAWARGHVQLSSLQAKRLTGAEHLARVNALSREEHAEERLELLKRAMVVADPKEVPQLARALISEAFAAERYRPGAAAAVRMREVAQGEAPDPADRGWRIEAITSLYGCSGPPLEARIEQVDYQPDMEIERPTGSVCARVVGLSSPCDVCLSDLSDYDPQERQHVLRDKVGVDNALSRHEDVIGSHVKTTTRLEDAFPRPSRMRVTIRVGSGAPPGRLFLFELPLDVERYAARPTVRPSLKEARVSEIALPGPAAEGRWEYWMSTLQWEDVAHGAVFAANPRSAWRSVQAFARELQAKPTELLTRNETADVVYSLHVSEHCGRCPTRRR